MNRHRRRKLENRLHWCESRTEAHCRAEFNAQFEESFGISPAELRRREAELVAEIAASFDRCGCPLSPTPSKLTDLRESAQRVADLAHVDVDELCSAALYRACKGTLP